MAWDAGRAVVLLLVLQLLVGAQLDRDLLLVLAAHERDLDLLAHLVTAQRDDQTISARNLVIVQLGDDIALLDAGLAAGPSSTTLATYAPLSVLSHARCRLGTGIGWYGGVHARRRFEIDVHTVIK